MFSGTVKLLDLNDYIKPGEECVVLTKKEETDKAAKVFLNLEDDIKPDLIKKDKTEKAKININDCLACNGCITSSEAILVEEQSVQKFLDQHVNYKQKFILLSPQSRVSIANKTGLTERQVHIKLSQFFADLGFSFISDFTVFIEVVKELDYALIKEGKIKPLLCSECPGWICYLEKVLGDKFIPYASNIKTPQLLASEIFKSLLSSSYGVKYEEIFCTLIAPCFDKKLEAAREEAKTERPVIDLVLSTNELYTYIEETNKEFFIDKIKENDKTVYLNEFNLIDGLIKGKPALEILKKAETTQDKLMIYKNHSENGSSSGYVDYMISKLKALYNIKEIHQNIRKNKNFTEIEVIIDKENKVFRFALVYGFKNIQNLIRQIKMKRCKYDYVEIMACPSGCINGGGQIQVENKLERAKELEKVTALFNNKEQINTIGFTEKLAYQIKDTKLSWLFNPTFIAYEFEAVKNDNVQTISW